MDADVDVEWVDRTFAGPEENLAADEALLEACESGEATGRRMPGVLRFYESERPFVVLGYGNRREAEVDLAACARDGVPVLRRSSGGGAVVLGPGCLAYALILPIRSTPHLETVTGTNRWVMERLRVAAEGVFGRPVSVQGTTDLTVGDLKCSGNAQRRRRHSVLFHGTFLLGFELEQVSRWLRAPTRQPEYRQGRAHGQFVTNLGVANALMKSGVRAAWRAERAWTGSWEPWMSTALAERYGLSGWHARC